MISFILRFRGVKGTNGQAEGKVEGLSPPFPDQE